MGETYKGYTIERSELSGASHKFTFQHKDYDGAPDAGDHRCGYGPTVMDCKQQIEEIEEFRSDRALARARNVKPNATIAGGGNAN